MFYQIIQLPPLLTPPTHTQLHHTNTNAYTHSHSVKPPLLHLSMRESSAPLMFLINQYIFCGNTSLSCIYFEGRGGRNSSGAEFIGRTIQQGKIYWGKISREEGNLPDTKYRNFLIPKLIAIRKLERVNVSLSLCPDLQNWS